MIDFDGVTQHLIKILGIPATAVAGEQQIQNKRQERAAQQQQMMEQQQLAEQAQAVGNAAPMVAAINK